MIPFDAVFNIGGKLIDKFFPDPEQAAKAKAELLQMQQDGKLKEIEIQLSAIVMEAQSRDPWTSRARPTFLYVMYALIIASIPMGVLFAFKPELAGGIAAGMQSWLQAIPGELYTLFGAGYLGYTGFRSYDKRNVLKGISKN